MVESDSARVGGIGGVVGVSQYVLGKPDEEMAFAFAGGLRPDPRFLERIFCLVRVVVQLVIKRVTLGCPRIIARDSDIGNFVSIVSE